MSGFLGIGGSAAKSDRKTEQQGFGDLANVFNFALPTATNLSSAGSSATGAASNYWSQLLSGNRATALAANAPATNATLASADAAKRQAAASGTARGGGTAGTSQQTNDQTRATIDNALFSVRPEAAKQEQQIGTSETSDALQALGLAGSTATSITGLASDSRDESNDLTNQVLGDFGSVIGGLPSIVKGISQAFGL